MRRVNRIAAIGAVLLVSSTASGIERYIAWSPNHLLLDAARTCERQSLFRATHGPRDDGNPRADDMTIGRGADGGQFFAAAIPLPLGWDGQAVAFEITAMTHDGGPGDLNLLQCACGVGPLYARPEITDMRPGPAVSIRIPGSIDPGTGITVRSEPTTCADMGLPDPDTLLIRCKVERADRELLLLALGLAYETADPARAPACAAPNSWCQLWQTIVEWWTWRIVY